MRARGTSTQLNKGRGAKAKDNNGQRQIWVILPEPKWEKLKTAIQVLGDEEVTRLIYTTLTTKATNSKHELLAKANNKQDDQLRRAA
jgi:hypothetical protein